MGGDSPRGHILAHSCPVYVASLTPTGFPKEHQLCAKSVQSYLTLCDPMDCTPPVSSVHGILQARIVEWVAMPSSRGSS